MNENNGASPHVFWNNTTNKNSLGTSSVLITDGQGNTGVDEQGNILTTIINITDGKNIGKITDLEIDEKGNVINFYVLQKRLFGFFLSNKETIFKLSDIKKIGEDVILVQIN